MKHELKSKKIAYVLPCPTISGGTAIVLQHLNRLKEMGFDGVEVLVVEGKPEIDWFPNRVKVRKYNKNKWEEESSAYDILIATHWTTAKIVFNSNAKRKIYFVQSDERRFVLSTENLEKVEETYRLKMEYMTEAIWIQRWLYEEFGHRAYYVPNGLDLKIFHKTQPLIKKSAKKRILLEGPLSSHLKGMNDAYKAVEGLGYDIWLVSSSGKLDPSWNINQYYTAVPQAEMPNIYSACDVFLKMSRVEGFFGPPMESMACGCPVVVSKCTGYDEYIIDGENALVVEMGDSEGAGNAVKRILTEKKLREKLIENGIKTSKEWSWDKSINHLIKVIEKSNPIEVYHQGKHERYDFVKEMRDLRFRLEVVDYATAHYRSEVIRLSNSGLREIRRISYKIVRYFIHHFKLFIKKHV